jgi:hypothetical protein
MKPKVLNRRTHRWPDHCNCEKHDVYVGRPSEFGNEFVEGRDGTREECVAKHKVKLLADATRLVRVKAALKGKNLVCWCTPKPCHAETLLEIANG